VRRRAAAARQHPSLTPMPLMPMPPRVRRHPDPETVELPLAAGRVPVRVKRSLRARRILLKVDTDGAELVLPSRASLASGLAFLGEKSGWLAAQLASVPPRVRFVHGAVVPILGIPHRIRHLGERGTPAVAIVDGEIRVRGQAEHGPRRVADHLKAVARQELAKRARALALRIDRQVARVTVRDTRSRWGSCAASGNLAFSWRLILAPKPVLNYVVAHEVAHLVHMNHGVRFWKLVDELVPGSAAPREWLRHHRAYLLSFG
jgi:predicted metal-dependent hydrolase